MATTQKLFEYTQCSLHFFLYVWRNYTYVTWLGLEMKNYSASEKILGLGLKRNSSHVFVNSGCHDDSSLLFQQRNRRFLHNV